MPPGWDQIKDPVPFSLDMKQLKYECDKCGLVDIAVDTDERFAPWRIRWGITHDLLILTCDRCGWFFEMKPKRATYKST
jgi:rubredoxin